MSFASPPSPPSVVEHAAETFLGRGASLAASEAHGCLLLVGGLVPGASLWV